ncbi:MAG: hypothetical protein P8Z77_07605, partial [Candidatus Thiodiazotropha sp.]
MYKQPMRLALATLCLLLVSMLSACGGGSSSSSVTASGRTGAVGVVLTDAPADPSLFSQINASIERVE